MSEPAPSYGLIAPLPFPLPFDSQSSLLAERTAWAIERLFLQDLTAELVGSHMSVRGNDPEAFLALMARFAAPVSAVTSYEERAPTLSVCDALDDQGRPRLLRVILSPRPPGRIRSFSVMHAPPAGVTIRQANDADGPQLRALEMRTPLIVDDEPIVYDRGDDYLASTRLMEDAQVFVAEHEGRIVGVHADAPYQARIGGVDHVLIYRLHTRIDPDYQGMRIFPGLNFASGTHYFSRMDDPPPPNEQSLIRVGNARMDEWSAASGSAIARWSTHAELCAIDCHASGGPATGRVGSPADAGHIVELCNAAHSDEQIFIPYTTDSLAQRLSRAADLYSWENFLIDDDAVVGVWNQQLRITRGNSTQQVRAVVLDTGFVPGPRGQVALERLLRACCTQLEASGTTHLVGFTSERSLDREVLTSLASSVDRFRHGCRVPEPQPPKGIRVDAIYF